MGNFLQFLPIYSEDDFKLRSGESVIGAAVIALAKCAIRRVLRPAGNWGRVFVGGNEKWNKKNRDRNQSSETHTGSIGE